MRLAIIGSRTVLDDAWVFDKLDETLEQVVEEHGDYIVILSGGAKGADTLAKEYAEKNGYDFVLFKPYHMIDKTVEYAPKYFFTRNKQLIDNCDMVIALCDGDTPGTRHAVKYATKCKKPVIELLYSSDE